MLLFCIVLSLTTEFAQASISHQELLSRIKRTTERDPYVFNLFEVILTTLDSKLRKVENMDKALEHLARRLDTMEGQLTLTLNTTSKIAHLLDVRLDSGCFRASETVQAPKQVTRVVRHRPYTGLFFESAPEIRKSSQDGGIRVHPNSGGLVQKTTTQRRYGGNRDQVLFPTVVELPFIGENPLVDREQPTNSIPDAKMEAQLEEVVKKVTLIDSKLSNLQEQLQEQLETNTVSRQTEELIASASESYKVGVGLGDRLQAVEKQQDLIHLENALEDVRNSLHSVDRRLQVHADAGQNWRDAIKEVTTLKEALIKDIKEERTNHCCTGTGNNNIGYCNNNFNGTDELFSFAKSSFEEMNNKTNQIMNSMLTSKDVGSLMDVSSLKEEQTVQTRLLDSIKKEVLQRSSRIMASLEEVKKEVRRVLINDKEALNGDGINPVALLHKSAAFGDHVESVTGAGSPPSDILDESILSEGNATGSADSGNDRSRHSSVIFPAKHRKPIESTFLSSSSEEELLGYSCLDLLKKGHTKSGIYHLKIRGTTYWFLQVYCDMTTAGGGWTVIQRREDFGEPRENFVRSWAAYKHGFGHPEKELWLGNENIYMLTNTEEYVLRVELEDFDGSKRYADYSTFKLHDETDLYKLEIGGYNGTAGDALNDPWYGSNLSPFSTYDKDNDRSSLNCASMLKGGWWWRSCGRGLNGLYLTNPNDFTARQGIVWFRWRGWDYTLKKTVLMIRPKLAPQAEEGVS